MRNSTSGRLRFFVCAAVCLIILASQGCRRAEDRFVLALEARPETLDPLRSTDASSERLRQLIFNTLVRKNERFEYVGELAETIEPAADGLAYTFKLRDGVRFHDGRQLTAVDAKYTLEALLGSDSRKAAPFFEGAGPNRQPRIAAIEAPDARTLVIRLRKPWPELLANLVPIGIIPQGSAEQQKTHPLGSGPFRFERYDESQQVVDLAAHENYWEGAPKIKSLRVRVILDANTLQAELRAGRISMAINTSLSPDAYRALAQDPNLQVVQSPGANIQYLGFNVQADLVKDARVRQAIAYAIDRESIVRDLLLGQARVAHSILPESSWAYSPGTKYVFDPERAKRLLDEAGLRDPDGDGPRLRNEDRPITLKISSSNVVARAVAGVIQNELKQVGLRLEIETLEDNVLRDAQRNGQYQMTIGRWVGGNQDPIFLRDLFMTNGAFNRSRYSNTELDRILQEATSTTDRERARTLYAQAQEIISREVPMLPLWYPDNMIVARRNISNIKIDPSGDWSFVRNVTVQ